MFRRRRRLKRAQWRRWAGYRDGRAGRPAAMLDSDYQAAWRSAFARRAYERDL